MSDDVSENVLITYDLKAQVSLLPIRRAAEIAICNRERQVLLVRRSNEVDEFKGTWSFPSTFIEDTVDDNHIHNVLRACLERWLALSTNDTRLVRRPAIRSQEVEP